MINFVYLAGPVDIADDAFHWRIQAADHLKHHGIFSFNPARAYAVPADVLNIPAARKIIQINREALLQADAVILYLDDSRTVGSFCELQLAMEYNKPVVIWMNTEVYNNSLYLFGHPQFYSLYDVVDYLIHGKGGDND